ncbi:MAG: M1 family metallopeptidase [Bryobacteraceae bacterium]
MNTSRLICIALSCWAAFAATSSEPPKLRLPENVRPVHYAIDLTIVPGQDSFKGTADIDIDIQQPQSVVWLNATELKIQQATFKASPVEVLAGNKDFTGFSFAQPVSGRGVLHVAYEGKITKNSSAGVFQLQDGNQWYVYTQFEPTDARRAFPCFDEPGFKVPWQLTLHVPNGHKAFGNTPQISESAGEAGMQTVKFAETKPLPSYLIAVGVGPFDIVSAGKLGSTPLRVITPRGRGSEAKFAAEAIPQLLKLLEQYFGTPFPYPKLDSIVMPISNFAMENAGLITYGQSLLLSKPENDSIGRQRGCAIVAAHEMAHQWFGDLVTAGWWNDIWLNEAFATWMENKVVQQWKPEWNTDVSAVDERLGAMGLDSLVSARKIRQPIVSDNDIANAFDGITYQKGAAVIHMFESWIGPEKFQQGVELYIKKHANGNATTADFEAAISQASGKNIAPAFDTFLDQAGVPVVTAALKCGTGKPSLALSQQRSLPIGSPGSKSQSWHIPVCVKYQSGGKVHRECELMADPRTEMTLREASACPAWILPNDHESGYYRVNYQGDLLPKLLSDSGAKLSVAERVGVLGDVQALVLTGDMPMGTALSVVPKLHSDPDRHITSAALDIAQNTIGVIVPEDLRPKGEKFIRDNFGERARELGWNAKAGEDENTRLLRTALVGPVASSGKDKQLIDQAEVLAKKWLVDRKGIDGDMLPEVLHVAAEFGNRGLFDQLHAAAKRETDPRVRQILLGAMGSFRDPAIARSAIALLLTGEFDIRQSFFTLLFGPSRYPETREVPFQFVKEHLNELLPKLPGEVGGDFAAGLPGVGRGFCDAEHRSEIKTYFEDKVTKYTGGPRNLQNTLERIDLCIARKKVLEPEIAEFLRTY